MDEDSVKKRMDEVVDLVSSDVSSIRTGRATPALVEDLQVAVYGGQQRLKVNELATINTSDPQAIVLEPWDKSIIGEIKKGIESANVGLSPNIDGEIIRINLPEHFTIEESELELIYSIIDETRRNKIDIEVPALQWLPPGKVA